MGERQAWRWPWGHILPRCCLCRGKGPEWGKAGHSPSQLGGRENRWVFLAAGAACGRTQANLSCFLLQPVKDYFPVGETAEGNDKAAADTALIKEKEQEKGKKKTWQDLRGRRAQPPEIVQGGRNVETWEYLRAAWSPERFLKRNIEVLVRLELWLLLAQAPSTHPQCLGGHLGALRPLKTERWRELTEPEFGSPRSHSALWWGRQKCCLSCNCNEKFLVLLVADSSGSLHFSGSSGSLLLVSAKYLQFRVNLDHFLSICMYGKKNPPKQNN